MEGILLFNKPTTWTNKSLLGFLRRTLNVPKLGHAGTLDPFAEGLMVVAIGRKFTRGLHTLLTASTKEYVATIELGATSDTFDLVGVVTPTDSTKRPGVDEIRTVIDTHLLGEHTQIPPVYSAKKILGKRLRDIATKEHAHEVAASRAKDVTLYTYEILSYTYPTLVIRLSVSSGYYIRTFGNELGKLLDTGAYLTSLVRTRINGHSLDDALSPEDIAGTIEVRGSLVGTVQGVGYRYSIENLARRYQCTGHVRNLPDGSVSFLVQGTHQHISSFLKFVLPGPFSSRVEDHFFLIKKPHEIFPDFSVQ